MTALVLGATCWPAVHAQDWRDGVAVSDSSAQLLTRKYDGDFTMAAVPPRVDFALVNLTAYGSGTPWGGWGECTWGPDSCFYFCVGNHKGGSDATALLVRYNPRTRTQTVLVNTRTVCQWADYGDGKIHGQPDISPTGDAWLLTFFGPYPTRSEWLDEYPGGRLIHHNVHTGTSEYLGIPAPDSWPLCTWDWQRSRLYAVGEHGMYQNATSETIRWAGYYNEVAYGVLLVYDTEHRSVVHGTVPVVTGSSPPDTIRWCRRSLFLDRQTGMLYGTEVNPSCRFVKYDPSTNRFSRMQSRLQDVIQGVTQDKGLDGAFYAADFDGNLVKFFPDQDRVESIGKDWLDGRGVESLRFSPGKRYVYYVADASCSNETGLPVVQLDTRTNRRTVLAFLGPYYQSRYGYSACCTYGVSLSGDGSMLFTQVNGNTGSYSYGKPAIFCIRIPQSLRRDDGPVTGVRESGAVVPSGRTGGRTGWSQETMGVTGPHLFDLRGREVSGTVRGTSRIQLQNTGTEGGMRCHVFN